MVATKLTPPAAASDASLWSEWERITRFLESARLAFDRERALWGSLGIAELGGVRITEPPDAGGHDVELRAHLAAVRDNETLFASVLVHSYALAESAATTRLSVDQRSCAGIEDWGTRLLAGNGRSWEDVRGDLGGAVEVAVVRNAFAHGNRVIDEHAEARLRKAGVTRHRTGSRIGLGYADLRGYRGRLVSLLRAGGVGQ